jgi:hypothetical protein
MFGSEYAQLMTPPVAVPFGVDDPAPFVPFGMKKRGKEAGYALAVIVVVGIDVATSRKPLRARARQRLRTGRRRAVRQSGLA